MGTQSEGVGPARADRAVVAELDVNPITVVPRGKGCCVAVDALIVPRASRGARP